MSDVRDTWLERATRKVEMRIEDWAWPPRGHYAPSEERLDACVEWLRAMRRARDYGPKLRSAVEELGQVRTPPASDHMRIHPCPGRPRG